MAIECPYCQGSGVCPRCHGWERDEDGQPCPVCEAGLCPNCDAGEVEDSRPVLQT